MAVHYTPDEEKRAVVVGVFENRGDAEHAIRDLQRAGFHNIQIGFAFRGAPPATSGESGMAGVVTGNEIPAAASEAAVEDATDPLAASSTAATGAFTGGFLGGPVGAAAALLVPGIGPVLAGGVIASALGGAAIGAAAGGLLGALVSIGVPESEARYYVKAFRSGRAIVTVRACEQFSAAADILRGHGASDRALRREVTPPTNPLAGDADIEREAA
ncbi:MAG TPA: hypothetical protein VGW38_27400 [Chloroflexota bacterium]|nr:hypothetical protein [Chloroflexota bacterium]